MMQIPQVPSGTHAAHGASPDTGNATTGGEASSSASGDASSNASSVASASSSAAAARASVPMAGPAPARPADQIPEGLRTIARPGRRSPPPGQPVAATRPAGEAAREMTQVSLADMPHSILQRIGSFIPPGDNSAARLASVDRNLAAALASRALADRLAASLDRPMPVPASHYMTVITRARPLPESLRLPLARKLMHNLPDRLPANNSEIVAVCGALRGLLAGFMHHGNRYELMHLYAAMLGDRRLHLLANPPAHPAQACPKMLQLHTAFVNECEKFLLGDETRPPTSARMRAGLVGALAGTVYFTNEPSQRAAAWHALAARSDCGQGDTRAPLLSGLADGLRRLPGSMTRRAAFDALCAELPSLSPPQGASLMWRLARAVQFVGTEELRVAPYDTLRVAARKLPQPQRSAVSQALVLLLHRLPAQHRQAMFQNFLSELDNGDLPETAMLLSALAKSTDGLPTLEGKVAAIDALLPRVAALDPRQGMQAAVDLIAVIEFLPCDMYRQIYFAKAARFVGGCAPELREPMIEALIEAAEAFGDPVASVGARLEVLALVRGQPPQESATLLAEMYTHLANERHDPAIYMLLSAFGAAAATLPPEMQVNLAGEATTVCLYIDGAFMRAQFQAVLDGAEALPEPYRTQALEQTIQALTVEVDELSETNPAVVPDAFAQLLRASAMLPEPQRVILLQSLGGALAGFSEETIDAAVDSLTTQIMRLPHALRGPLLRLVDFD